MKRRFCLNQTKSPTYFNLAYYLKQQGWHESNFSLLSELNEHLFDFDEQAAQTLEYKHLLANLVAKYCPNIIPKTYVIDDHNWLEVMNKITTNENDANKRWILKPSMLNNGEHIHLLDSMAALEKHYLATNRLAGEHVLQEYITNPHLITKKNSRIGHKYSIRMFMILSTFAGCCLFPHGYMNIALHPYPANDFSDLRPHLCNEHLAHGELNVQQVATEGLSIFQEYFALIENHLSLLCAGLMQEFPQAFTKSKHKALAIFGMDFMLDNTMHVYLLEANHGPCFPTDEQHPLFHSIYRSFWLNFIDRFILEQKNDSFLPLTKT